jgi:phosphatidylserine/phosphatidylglycerophosphate/cardiolipin synthase-like enzyme
VAQAVRALLNDPATTKDVLVKAKVTSPTATAILAHRSGSDGALHTADDDPFDTLKEVDAIKGVGPATLNRLVAAATAGGYVDAEKAKARKVIFSPQPADASHTAEVAKLIAGAKRSIDIAMYSYSDAGIASALSDAVSRGVKVRFVYDGARSDHNLKGTALASSKSGKLEAAGVDVRYVDKIMHHKFMIVDGPRDDLAAAKTATVVTGSANWSSGGATVYDENTLFMTAYPELALRMQREFNIMWDHSNDFVSGTPKPFEASSLVITEDMMPLDPGLQVFYTSDNFSVKGAVFSTVGGRNTIADELVRAIDGAKTRIHIASGHLRSRPVAEALLRKAAESPDLDIRIYLDEQEYISESGNAAQKSAREDCLAAAKTDAQTRNCLDKNYLYSLDVANAGADLRYKFYAYRWDASYAAQMHDKIFLVDGTLYTGSYNLSDNAEHQTFENVVRLQGPEFEDLVEQYDAALDAIWDTGAGLLAPLEQKIQDDPTIPIVFPPMALDWTEVRDLKSLISSSCPSVNSSTYRGAAASHKTCTK